MKFDEIEHIPKERKEIQWSSEELNEIQKKVIEIQRKSMESKGIQRN